MVRLHTRIWHFIRSRILGEAARTSSSWIGRWRLLALFGTGYLSLGLLLRIVLWFALGSRSGVSLSFLPAILAFGVWADLRLSMFLLAPFSLYLWLVPNRLYRSRVHRALGWVLVSAVLFGMIYSACVEYFFFEEFDSRFNLVAVDYLLYPHEVLINIWDSYPVATTLCLVGLLAAFLVWAFRRPLRAALGSAQPLRARTGLACAHCGLIIVLALVTANRSSADRPFPTNRAAHQMASNGLAAFFEALQTSELDYHAYYRTGDPKRLRQRLLTALGTTQAQAETREAGGLRRPFSVRSGTSPKQPNVVILLEESFGAEFVGVYGDDRGLTPAFDELSKRGLLFGNAYSTGTRTVRGLEAITASFPPIPSVSIVKRPGGDHVANWGKVMRNLGYETSFLYGGYGYFDNMNHFFSGNGFETKDRTDIEDQTFTNIWGVCDEDLFRYAVRHFDEKAQQEKPFFSIVLSTSNHKPFTFPAGIPGVPQEGGGRKAGVRYADYAIGRFFTMAQERPWFENTLFVVVADHGARVYGAAQIPLYSYEIPLLMIWPGGIEPGLTEAPISLMDLAPTVLGFLGQAYEAPFFGQDALDRPPGQPPVLLFNHNHDVGALRGDELVVLGLKRSVRSYHYQRETGELTEIPVDSDLAELTVAYYQTAFDLFRDGRYR